MGKLRVMAEERAWELHDRLQSEAQTKFIYQVMEDEDVDWTVARAICLGRTDPKEPEYTLGYKLADPMIMMAMFSQPGRKARQQAIENFEKDLDEDELRLFREQVLTMNTRDRFRSALKSRKKDPHN